MFDINTIYFISVIASTAAILFGLFLIWQIRNKDDGDEAMQKISRAIQEGAFAFLKREYTAVAILALIISTLLFFVLGLKVALGFLLGGIFSAFCGAVGMSVSVLANVKTAQGAKKSLKDALDIAFKGGSVTGFLVVGLALLAVTVFYLLTRDLNALVGLGFGASLISIFARLGGGIYTKGADVGADLVGKVESSLPEDDPRNPAVIADLVGDNVGDCAGMAADLFETYAVTMVSAMLLGNFLGHGREILIALPLLLGSVSIATSMIASFAVRLFGDDLNIMGALYKGLGLAMLLSIILFFGSFEFLSLRLKEAGFNSIALFWASILGILLTGVLVVITEYYTSKNFGPVKKIAKNSTTGHGTNIITGLATSMQSTALPVLLIALVSLLAFQWAGLYGVAMAAVAMLSLTGIIVAIDSFGPITDNAGGIAEMAGLSEEVRERTDALDSVGNTTKAITKAYAIGSAGLAVLVLFSAFSQELAARGKDVNFLLSDPYVLAGLFIGGVLPYLFGSLALEAVGKAGASIVEEVRRQLKEKPGILNGSQKPEYGRAVDIVTQAALREMFLPALIPVLSPIIVGFLLGPKALGGLLVGSIISGLLVAISMTTGGAAWDNAKKHIESGNHGGKKSFAHQAAITGDTVGDPYKDTAGPAINPMIKIINIVALLLVPFLK